MPRDPGRNLYVPLDLRTVTLSAAGTVVGGTVSALNGATHLLLRADYTYTSGIGTADVYVQTSVNGTSNWTDIAQFKFTSSTASKIYALNATSVTTAYTPTDGSMSADSCKDGILGSALRVKTVVGTAGTATLAVTALAK